MNSNKIYDFANENKNVTEAQIKEFAETLYKDYPLDKVVLRRLIRIYTMEGETLYDMDYDTQLKRAIEIANDKNYYTLLSKTKTLLEIEAANAEAENQSEN